MVKKCKASNYISYNFQNKDYYSINAYWAPTKSVGMLTVLQATFLSEDRMQCTQTSTHTCTHVLTSCGKC